MRAAVAVPGPVRRVFTYGVPADLERDCRPGVRVLVPFGGRRATGCVVALEPPEEAAPAMPLKSIERILDAAPALDGPLLDLTRWGAEYYAASWGEMIRCALPGWKTRTRLEVSPSAGEGLWGKGGPAPAPVGASGPLGRAAREALRAVRVAAGSGTFVPLAKVRSRTGVPVSPSLARRLARRGLLNLRESISEEGGAPALALWAVPVTPPVGGASRLGRRQQAILATLGRSPEGVPAAALGRASGSDHAALRSLEKKGLVRLERRELARVPLALRTVPEAGLSFDPTAEQAAAVDAVTAPITARRYEPFLLFGVTGSGKTEVYLRAVEAALAAGRQALYLVPEIGLTPLLAQRLRARFGGSLALLHSGLSEGERGDEWRRVRRGGVRVVLGARSAVFAPLADPGVIVVDEEHDASYKQDEGVRYHARDLAIVRGRASGSAVILGSATPSMESYHHALRGKYRLLALPGRVGGSVLPRAERVDMRREFEETGADRVLSRRLLAALQDRLARGEQSLILLNRRGFSTFVLCRACGRGLDCRSCSIALTLHLREKRLRCHYCGQGRAVPASCPACGGPLHFGGAGTERLEETLRSLLPGARLARMDRDTVRGRGAREAMLSRVEKGDVDILLGTQMIAKGHDFPRVTLVGVLAADALLGLPDFRAGERTFQLLAQAGGRSGRRERPGEVVVQAFDADHHAVRAACDHDFEGFARDELTYRRTLDYPPFAALALFVFRDRIYERAAVAAGRLAEGLRRRRVEALQVLGPAPAPLERLRGAWRVQVMIKGRSRTAVREALTEATALLERAGERAGAVTIDVDPVSTL